MKETEYLDKVARYGVWQWRSYKESYKENERIGPLYKCQGWAKRKATQLNSGDIVPLGGYVVRRVWVKK